MKIIFGFILLFLLCSCENNYLVTYNETKHVYCGTKNVDNTNRIYQEPFSGTESDVKEWCAKCTFNIDYFEGSYRVNKIQVATYGKANK